MSNKTVYALSIICNIGNDLPPLFQIDPSWGFLFRSIKLYRNDHSGAKKFQDKRLSSYLISIKSYNVQINKLLRLMHSTNYKGRVKTDR